MARRTGVGDNSQMNRDPMLHQMPSLSLVTRSPAPNLIGHSPGSEVKPAVRNSGLKGMKTKEETKTKSKTPIQ